MGGRSPSPSSTDVARPPLGPLIWSSRSQTTAGTWRFVEREDRKKSWAESLRPTHSLYLSDFRWVTTALDRPPPERGRGPCTPRPVFIDLFLAPGVADPLCSRPMRPATVVGVRLHGEQGDDAAHDLETANGQGPHGPVAQARSITASLAAPFLPPCPSGAVPWAGSRRKCTRGSPPGSRNAGRSRPWSGNSSHDPAQEGGPSMTPRHTTLAPVAHGGVRAVGHGRRRRRTGTGRGDAPPVPKRKGGQHDPEHHRGRRGGACRGHGPRNWAGRS